MISSIGPYALDSDIAGHHGLAELSRAEYLVLPKDFPDERIYKVPDYEFLGFRWNHLLIGVINSRIYKLSPQIITEDLGEAQRVFTAAFAYLLSLMGSWLPVTVAVLVCNVFWWPIKHRWINLTLAELVGLLCRLLKWPISIACAAYLLFHAERGQAIVALLWPLVILLAKIPVESVMATFGWPPQVGRLQKLFMRRLGYEDTTTV
jgi:hypothetical protein